MKELRTDFLRQILRQEVSFFDTPSISISGQITTNGNLISSGISEKLGTTIQAMSSFVAAFVVAFAVQWKLTLIVMGIVPVNIIVTIICVMVDTNYEYQMFDIFGKAGSLAEEAFSSIRTAHAFWAFTKLTRRFDTILDDAAKIGAKKSTVYAILFPTEFFCIFAGYGLAFWQGMRMYSSGEIQNPGSVVTYGTISPTKCCASFISQLTTISSVIFAVLVAAQALTQIAPQTIAMSKAAAAAADIFKIIDRKSKIDVFSGTGDTINNPKGEITLENVWFEYPTRPNVPVLCGLSLQIPAGKTTALVGASGSGKSTIFGLIERWYLPGSGAISIDGSPIDSLNLQWLRNSIRLVQQVSGEDIKAGVSNADIVRNQLFSVAAFTRTLSTALQMQIRRVFQRTPSSILS